MSNDSNERLARLEIQQENTEKFLGMLFEDIKDIPEKTSTQIGSIIDQKLNSFEDRIKQETKDREHMKKNLQTVDKAIIEEQESLDKRIRHLEEYKIKVDAYKVSILIGISMAGAIINLVLRLIFKV